MKRHSENLFTEKFRLLNSQGSTEEINWSSSDSNEFENVPSNVGSKFCNVAHKNRKRKRKKKGAANISNLSITYVDPSNEYKGEFDCKVYQESCKYPEQTSPILCTSQYFPPQKRKVIPSSPILLNSVKEALPKGEKSLKSPIIVLKTSSPKLSPKVTKKLFDFPSQSIHRHMDTIQKQSKSSNACLDRRKSDNNHSYNSKSLNLSNKVLSNIDFIKTHVSTVNNDKHKEHAPSPFINDIDINNVQKELNEDFDINFTIQETPDTVNVDDSMVMLKTSSADLASKVKSYFDSHFSSDSASQLTISEVQTPKSCSKTSEDIEIISTVTQITSNRNSAECESEPEVVNKKGKKLHFKKNGLAYRLNSLLKKQNASISLWQHERFLAANSNFVIPKGEFKVFRICKIQFNYGVYLLEAVDSNKDNYLILINKTYISHENIKQHLYFKLYEPYKVMDYQNNCKLIINVNKFEFVEAGNS